MLVEVQITKTMFGGLAQITQSGGSAAHLKPDNALTMLDINVTVYLNYMCCSL